MSQPQKTLKRKLRQYLFITVLIFLALTGRLFQLQVLNAHEFRTQSEENRIRVINKEARRGDIISSDGKVLATSMPVFTISIAYLSDRDLLNKSIEQLVDLLDLPEITEELIQQKIRENARKFEPVEITTLPWDEKGIATITKLEERRGDMPAVVIEEVPQRYYPQGTLAGHIIGYVGLINPRELDSFSDYQYGMHDKIGKTGIERVAEIRELEEVTTGLRGKNGLQQVEVNAANRPIRELVDISPTPGDNVYLTIDTELQAVMEKSMAEIIEIVKEENPKAGAGGAVLMDVNTGAILAIASTPEMNPNDFVDGSFSEKQQYYNDSELKPEFNRAIRGTYPPGSTFKMITLMAALESQAVNLRDTVICSGAYWRPPYIKCWGVHGRVDFYRAIAVSCNTYVQNAAYLTGIDGLVSVGEQFGLGTRSGSADLLGEERGLLPTPDWKRTLNDILLKRRYEAQKDTIEKKYQTLRGSATTIEDFQELDRQKDRELAAMEAQYRIDYNFATNWHPYDTYNTSIGQGSTDFTVLQLANYTATVANGGTRYIPYLIDQIVSPQGDTVVDYQPQIAQLVDVSGDTIKHVQRGMHEVTKPGGTAYYLFSDFPPEITVGAKTGTAQTGRVGDDKSGDFHGVFVAYAPVENPEIAFAGIIEYGKTGGGSAGVVAKAIFEEYFGLSVVEIDELDVSIYAVE